MRTIEFTSPMWPSLSHGLRGDCCRNGTALAVRSNTFTSGPSLGCQYVCASFSVPSSVRPKGALVDRGLIGRVWNFVAGPETNRTHGNRRNREQRLREF